MAWGGPKNKFFGQKYPLPFCEVGPLPPLIYVIGITLVRKYAISKMGKIHVNTRKHLVPQDNN